MARTRSAPKTPRQKTPVKKTPAKKTRAKKTPRKPASPIAAIAAESPINALTVSPKKYSKRSRDRNTRYVPKPRSARIKALTEWNYGKDAFCIPRRGSQEAAEVKNLQMEIESGRYKGFQDPRNRGRWY